MRDEAANIANGRLEAARSLNCDRVGLHYASGLYGDPAGEIVTPETVGKFVVDTECTWVRTATGRAAYKKVTVRVYWEDPIPNQVEVPAAASRPVPSALDTPAPDGYNTPQGGGPAMARKWNLEPEIVTLPDITVATVHTSGNPDGLGADVMKALYGAAYGLKSALKKRGIEMKLGEPRARWQWTPGQDTTGELDGDWALPVPDGTVEEDLQQKSDRYDVSIDTWKYGECARIVHAGAYDNEERTIARLVEFIAESGYEVSGVHEEWYMSPPAAKVPKTVILYTVRRV